MQKTQEPKLLLIFLGANFVQVFACLNSLRMYAKAIRMYSRAISMYARAIRMYERDKRMYARAIRMYARTIRMYVCMHAVSCMCVYVYTVCMHACLYVCVQKFLVGVKDFSELNLNYTVPIWGAARKSNLK